MRITIALLLLCTFACASFDDPDREREERASKPGTNQALKQRIGSMRNGAAADDLHVRVEWSRSGAMTSAELFGSHAAIFNDQVAGRVTDADLAAVVRAIDQSHFVSMPSRFGEADSDFMKLHGSVTVSAGGTAKTVVQMETGPQSEALAILAAEIITIVENVSRTGTRVTSLSSALAQVGAAIPDEALHLTVQRRDDRPQPSEAGWLLRLRGREAIARRYTNAGGYEAEKRLTLSADEFARVVAALRDADLASLAANTYAPMYTDFRIDVLDQSRDLQARRYPSPAPNPKFDALIDQLGAVAMRVIRDGK